MPELIAAVERHLAALVEGHPDRHPGRPGNVAANDHAESVLLEHGWSVESAELEVLDARLGAAQLTVGGRSFDVKPGPYTVPAQVSGPLLPIDSLAALEDHDLQGTVVLLHGLGR